MSEAHPYPQDPRGPKAGRSAFLLESLAIVLLAVLAAYAAST